MTTYFHDYSLVRLLHKNGPEIVHHIISLNDSDRYLRFGYVCSDEQVAKYVSNTINQEDVQKNFWYGIYDQTNLIATLHVAMGNGLAEFAFTTDEKYRGQKLGQLLFARGYQLATEFQISRIFMACLSQNAAMRHIAKKFGMAVVTHGTDSEASINITYPVPLSKISEVHHILVDKGIV